MGADLRIGQLVLQSRDYGLGRMGRIEEAQAVDGEQWERITFFLGFGPGPRAT